MARGTEAESWDPHGPDQHKGIFQRWLGLKPRSRSSPLAWDLTLWGVGLTGILVLLGFKFTDPARPLPPIPGPGVCCARQCPHGPSTIPEAHRCPFGRCFNHSIRAAAVPGSFTLTTEEGLWGDTQSMQRGWQLEDHFRVE